MLLIKKIIAIYIVSLIFSATAFSNVKVSSDHHNKVEFDINGLKIGDKLTSEFSSQYCLYKHEDGRGVECRQKVILNETELSILYFFYDQKLLAISFNYPSEKYENLIGTYTKKLSRSPESVTKEISVSTSDKYINNISSWHTTNGVFVINQYGSSFTKGLAYLKSTKYEEYLKNKKREINQGNFSRIARKIVGYILD